MNHERDTRRSLTAWRRNGGVCCAILALSAGLLATGTACNDDEALAAFREAASSNLQTGVNSLMDGVVDGLFAAMNLGTDQSSTSGSSSSTGSSGSSGSSGSGS